jgi:hypothetical protein
MHMNVQLKKLLLIAAMSSIIVSCGSSGGSGGSGVAGNTPTDNPVVANDPVTEPVKSAAISDKILEAHTDVNTVYVGLSDDQQTQLSEVLSTETARGRFLKQIAVAATMLGTDTTTLFDTLINREDLQPVLEQAAMLEIQSGAMLYALNEVSGSESTEQSVLTLLQAQTPQATAMANAALSMLYFGDCYHETDATYNSDMFTKADDAITRFTNGGSTIQALVDEVVRKDGVLTEHFTVRYYRNYERLNEALDEVLADNSSATTDTFVVSIVNYLIEEHSRTFNLQLDSSATNAEGQRINSSMAQTYTWAGARGGHAMQEGLTAVWYYQYQISQGQSQEDIISRKPELISDSNVFRAISLVDMEAKFSDSWRVSNYEEIDKSAQLAASYLSRGLASYIISYTHQTNPVGVTDYGTAFLSATPYTLNLSYDATAFNHDNSFVVVKEDDSTVAGTNYGSDGLPSYVDHIATEANSRAARNIIMLVTGTNQNACQWETSRDLGIIRPVFIGRKPQPDMVSVTALDVVFDSGVTAVDDSLHYTDDLLNVDDFRDYLAFVTNHHIFKSSDQFTQLIDDGQTYQFNDWMEDWIAYKKTL